MTLCCKYKLSFSLAWRSFGFAALLACSFILGAGNAKASVAEPTMMYLWNFDNATTTDQVNGGNTWSTAYPQTYYQGRYYSTSNSNDKSIYQNYIYNGAPNNGNLLTLSPVKTITNSKFSICYDVKRDNNTNSIGEYITLKNSSNNSIFNTLLITSSRTYLNDNNTTSYTTSSAWSVLANDSWHNVCLVYNQGITSGYIDGQYASYFVNSLSGNASDIKYLMLYTQNGYSDLDNLVFFNHALTDSEISKVATNAMSNTFVFNASSGGDTGGYQFIDATTVEGLYFHFDNILNQCRVDTTCKLGYTFDSSIFGYAGTGKVYYYASSTAPAQYIGTINLDTQKDLGIFGSGNLSVGTSTPSTAFSYYEVVPHSSLDNSDYATSTVGVYFISQAAWEEQTQEIAYAETSTANSIFGDLNTRSMACTEEEWSSTSSIPFLGVNVQLMMCNTRKWLLDTGLKPMSMIRSGVISLRDDLMTRFPFTIFNSFKTNWDDQVKKFSLLPQPALAGSFISDIASSSNSVSVSYSTSTGVASMSNLNISFGNAFGDTSAPQRIDMVSSSTIKALLGTDGFNWLNLALSFIIWILFAFYLYDLVKYRIPEILGEE